MHQKVAKAIVNDRLEFNKGMIFENIVAQMFRETIKNYIFIQDLILKIVLIQSK